MNKSNILITFLLLFCFSCSNNEEVFNEEESMDVTINSDGDPIYIEIASKSGNWEVRDIPEWLKVEHTTTAGITNVVLSALPSEAIFDQKSTIVFYQENHKVNINILQTRVSYAEFSTRVYSMLPIFSFRGGSIYLMSDYTIQANEIFINAANYDKIYLGSLLSYNVPSFPVMHQFLGYTPHPITVSSGELLDSKSFLPNLADQSIYAQQIIDQSPKETLFFRSDLGTGRFYSYKQLRAIGMVNFGLELDILVNGKPYTELEIGEKKGIVFSFRSESFRLNMDVSDGGKLVKEDISEEDQKIGVGYVSSMKYGKINLLLVETANGVSDTKDAINKRLKAETLSGAEQKLIEESDISYVYFKEKNEAVVVHGQQAIDAYIVSLQSPTEDLHPITFSLNNIGSHLVNGIQYSFVLEGSDDSDTFRNSKFYEFGELRN